MQSNTFRNLIPPLLATTLVLWNPFAWPFAVIAVLGILFWMIAWWLGERIPLAVTALLPILLFPPLHILSLEATTAAYGDKYVFLFLGGIFTGPRPRKNRIAQAFFAPHGVAYRQRCPKHYFRFHAGLGIH
jgi:di/tricarboxylate transporter